MELAGRQSEQKMLQDSLDYPQSALVAVVGRRRIGKTFLIRKFYGSQIVFDFTGLHHGDMADQLIMFGHTLVKAGYRQAVDPPKTWLSAFLMLQYFLDSIKTQKKKVIFLDELPWMDTPRSKFLMAFENFWNSYCARRSDLVVVISGSAASWMIKKVLHNKGGLYNRVTHKIHLQPFNLCDTEAFLKSKGIVWSRFDITQCYMMVGGVPYYLDMVRKGESVMQFIDRVCFAQDGMLHTEFEELFSSLFFHPERHYKIIVALSTLKKGMIRDDLLAKSGLPSGGTFTETLDELLASGFVKKQAPYQKEKQGTLYRLADPFILFHQKFLKTRKSAGHNSWLKLADTPAWYAWAGLAFENLCLQHTPQLKEALKLTAIATEESGWHGSADNANVQIDLVIDRADRIVHLCEMKFSKAPFAIDKKYADELRLKRFVFSQQPANKRKTLFLTFITTFGLTLNEYSQELVQNQLTINDLFAPQ